MQSHSRAHYRVVIVGGGVVGASVLYHLAKLGWTDVALVERSVLTAGSSWHAAGGVHALNADPNMAALQAYTIDLLSEIEKESGQDIGLHMTGGITVASVPERWEWLQSAYRIFQTIGIEDCHLMTPDEIREKCPIMDVTGVIGGLWADREGYLDTTGTVHAYAGAARKRGATVIEHNKVEALDHELVDNLFVRAGYQFRRTTSNFLVNPARLADGRGSELVMNNDGADLYREFQASVRYRLRGTGHLTLSYVKSSSYGDLNDIGAIYGPTPSALIQPNERAPLRFDVPHRLLAWTEFDLPFGIKSIPVWDVRSGFPHSRLDELRRFVGPRNRAGRFPLYNALDLQVTKRLRIPFRGKDRIFRTGIRLFNLLNNFNPQDVQENFASAHHGVFYRGIKRKIRAVFEIEY